MRITRSGNSIVMSAIGSLCGLRHSRYEVVDGVPTFFCLPEESPLGAAEEAHGHAVATHRAVRLVLDDDSVEIGPGDVLFLHNNGSRRS